MYKGSGFAAPSLSGAPPYRAVALFVPIGAEQQTIIDAFGPAGDDLTLGAFPPTPITDDGCGPATLPEWDDYQPAGAPLSGPMRSSLRTGNDRTTLARARRQGLTARTPTDTKGRDLRLVRARDENLMQYFAGAPIPRGLSLSEAIALGAIYVYEHPSGDEDLGRRALRTLGYRAAAIRVGPYTASFSHDDPIAEGVRPYSIRFTAGRDDYLVMGDVDDPRDLIEIARSMVCGAQGLNDGADPRAATDDLLAHLTTSQVEPGVLRVISDGFREFTRPCKPRPENPWHLVVRDCASDANIAVGLDGSVWVFDEVNVHKVRTLRVGEEPSYVTLRRRMG